MVFIIILNIFWWDFVGSQKEISRFSKNAFFGHHMNKLQILKVLKIGFRVTNHRLSWIVEVHFRQESSMCSFRKCAILGIAILLQSLRVNGLDWLTMLCSSWLTLIILLIYIELHLSVEMWEAWKITCCKIVHVAIP